jgi:hypothetical protein
MIVAAYSGYQAWKTKAEARRSVAEAQSCRAKAQQGDPKAEVQLGSLSARGEVVQQDYTQTLYWFRKAADQGYASGEYGIGYLYEKGAGVPRSDSEALHWLQFAAGQGYARAEAALGSASLKGGREPQSDADAVRWFRKAADQKDPAAEYGLGWMERYGRGVPQNRQDALRLMRLAADQGDPDAVRAVTRSLTPWMRGVLVLIFLFSVWMLTEFFYDWPAHANDPKRRRFDTMLPAFWALNAAFTDANWYGYAHHKILCIGCGMNAFTACHYILGVLVLAGFVTVLRTGKRVTADEPSGPEPGSDEDPGSAPLSTLS